MPRYHHDRCEDDEDATRMAEVILRELGYTDVQKGSNIYSVAYEHTPDQLTKIARNAERIARWARNELKG